MNRLLGPVGGAAIYLLVAGLVFAGLGWVTLVGLRVEREREEAAARAELGHDLRAALWRLDGRLAAVLGGEDARPYPHYTPFNPATDPGGPYGPGCAPLLSAELPDWMRLHVEFDEPGGWTSPQVLPEDAKIDLRARWPDLPLRNTTEDRIELLDRLNREYPARHAGRLLAALDRPARPPVPPPAAAKT
ncbi:MAG: hypothetical protein K2X87_06350, partial [Gemmataceae bacterium]|nr:hypothetical protein [Gemmataceae bacterium]